MKTVELTLLLEKQSRASSLNFKEANGLLIWNSSSLALNPLLIEFSNFTLNGQVWRGDSDEPRGVLDCEFSFFQTHFCGFTSWKSPLHPNFNVASHNASRTWC